MNAGEQISGWWRSLTGRNASESRHTPVTPNRLCPECGGADLDEHFNRETSTQSLFCRDCGFQERHEILFDGGLRGGRLRRSPG